MTKFLFTLLLLAFALCASAQSDTQLQAFNQKRNDINTKGMLILGTWALGNIALGTTNYYRQTGTKKYFNQMNALWNTVNLTLAVATSIQAHQIAATTDTLTIAQSIAEQHKTQQLFLFNAGLDFAYIASGFYLIEKAKNTTTTLKKNQFEGWGKSLILQGSFLLVFDGLMVAIHQNNSKIGYKLISAIRIEGNQIGVCWQF